MERTIRVSVVWRRNKHVLEMNANASLKQLGDELLKSLDVKQDTMRLIVPQLSNRGPRLLLPFSEEHAGLTLQEASVVEGKPIRMMGVSEDEVYQVLKDAKADLRIAGFDEEDNRLKQRLCNGSQDYPKLPQGPYIFCDFKTLQIPGIELNPPPSKALKIMYRLAADPGIVAIMTKHRWRVGMLTELAPVGYVGISPKCILGLNKNFGEEISLRLRTDNLQGFRKYDSIKKTLLHELTHMVYPEHDENFYALNSKLNEEAASLDWTKSTGHTLNGSKSVHEHVEQNDFTVSENASQKLGGNTLDQLASARESSVAAAYHRLANNILSSEANKEPNSIALDFVLSDKIQPIASSEDKDSRYPKNYSSQFCCEPDPDDSSCNQNENLHDLDDCSGSQMLEPDPDDQGKQQPDPKDRTQNQLLEPDPDDCLHVMEPDPDDLLGTSKPSFDFGTEEIVTLESREKGSIEHEPELDGVKKMNDTEREHMEGNTSAMMAGLEPLVQRTCNEADMNEKYQSEVIPAKPDPDDTAHISERPNVGFDPEDPSLSPGMSSMNLDELDPDDQELRIIQVPVAAICSRLQKAIESLRAEVNPTEAIAVLQTLSKIIGNVIQNPNVVKFKRLRKENPVIQRTIVNHKAAIEILSLVGFIEDVVSDDVGKLETYLVLKRNDPGLLWLAKSSLETFLTH